MGNNGMNPKAPGQTNPGGDSVINHTILKSPTCSPLTRQPQMTAKIPHPQGDASQIAPQCGGMGDHLDYQEITLGQVTYEIRRVYTGERSAADLVLERLSQVASEKLSFDVDTNPAV